MKAYILRGIPGSGKSTLARRLAGQVGRVHSTDDFFMKNGVYVFDSKLLERNHKLNLKAFCQSLNERVPIVVLDNTNSRRWEYAQYIIAARANGYEVEVISIEHLRPEVAVERTLHQVPVDAIKQMIARWEIDPSETNTPRVAMRQGDEP